MIICNNTANIANIHPLLINQSQSGQSQNFSELVQAASYGDMAGATSGRASDSQLAQTINDRGTAYGSSMQSIEDSPMFIRALGGDRIIASDTSNLTAVSYANTLNQRAAEMRSQGTPYSHGSEYCRSSQYIPSVPMGQAAQYGQSAPYGQTSQVPQYGQYGQTAPYGQTSQVPQYGQYGQTAPYGQTNQMPQNGQYGQTAPYGQTSQVPQYGQYGQTATGGQSPYGQQSTIQSPNSQSQIGSISSAGYSDVFNQTMNSQSQIGLSNSANYKDWFNYQMASTNSRGTTITNGIKELVTCNSSNAADKEINTEARQLGRDLRSLVKSGTISTADMNTVLGQFTTLADAGYHRASSSEMAYDADKLRATLQKLISKNTGGDTSKLTQTLSDTTLLSGSLVKRAYQSSGSGTNCFGTISSIGSNGNYGANSSSNYPNQYSASQTTDSYSIPPAIKSALEQIMKMGIFH